MGLSLRITSVTFSGSTQPVPTGDSDLIILIGPNNTGKSRALREIRSHLIAGSEGEVVVRCSAERGGDMGDLDAWVEAAMSRGPEDPATGPSYVSSDGTLWMRQAQSLWLNQANLEVLGRLLVKLVDAETRLMLARSVDSIDALNGQAVEPLQRLLTDHAAENRLSAAVRRAFGRPVEVNRTGGSKLHLILGQATTEARVDNPEYLREISELPLVAEQGDGMRSFIGLLLTLIATPYPVVLIDEPEAFLHPPQAREMGRQLASQGESQRFVATHDSSVLLGLLDHAESATIVRLRREGNRNTLSPRRSAMRGWRRRDPLRSNSRFKA